MGETRFILAGYLIDGSGAGARKQVFLAVTDGRIAAIGAATDLPVHAGVVIDDLSHGTIVPALVDCSVALTRSSALDPRMRTSREEAESAQQVALIGRHLRYCHAHGVLGVAVSDDPAGLVGRSAAETTEGGIVALRTSGRLCQSRDDGVGGGSSGRDFLKIGYSADIDAEAGESPRLRQEDLRHILLHHKKGNKVVVVANGRQAVAEALAAGCDAIEQGYRMGEDNLRTMAAQQVLWIPSLVRAKNGLDGAASGGEVCCRFSQRYVAPGKPIPGAEVFWKQTLADQLAQLRRARALGVPTAVGTGAGNTGILHGESVVEEMKLFIKAGYALEEAIRCASEQGARFFGMNDLGMLAVGQRATFLVTRGTPQQLPRKLSYLENVYIDGAPISAYRKS